MEGSFQSTSFGWEVQQLRQQIGEWFSYQFARSGDNAPVDLGDLPSIPNWFFQLMFWLLVGIVAVRLGLWLTRWSPVGWRWLQGRWASAIPQVIGVVEPRISAATWLKRSQTYQQQGNFAEASRALYFAMIQRLHETQRLLHQPSRTDGEYRKAVESFSRAPAYTTLINTHERLHFGDGAVSEADFARCQQAYREIDQAP